jgi:hypothetical protein
MLPHFANFHSQKMFTTDVIRYDCVLNTAVNLPDNSITDFIVIAGLLHSE